MCALSQCPMRMCGCSCVLLVVNSFGASSPPLHVPSLREVVRDGGVRKEPAPSLRVYQWLMLACESSEWFVPSGGLWRIQWGGWCITSGNRESILTPLILATPGRNAPVYGVTIRPPFVTVLCPPRGQRCGRGMAARARGQRKCEASPRQALREPFSRRTHEHRR